MHSLAVSEISTLHLIFYDGFNIRW